MNADPFARRLFCDSRDCGESTPLPISLRAEQESSAAGWVFVTNAYEERHYCPSCAAHLLPGRSMSVLG